MHSPSCPRTLSVDQAGLKLCLPSVEIIIILKTVSIINLLLSPSPLLGPSAEIWHKVSDGLFLHVLST